MSTPTTAPVANTTTAIVIWNDALAAEVTATVLAGNSVKKDVAMAAPKGFIGKLRAQRRAKLEGMSGAIYGQMQQNNAKVIKFKSRIDAKGNIIRDVRSIEYAVTAEQKEIAELKAMIVKYEAQLASK